MPGMNGTGPMGRGPMTGRRMGLCNKVSADRGASRHYGRGLGLGYGTKRGLGRLRMTDEFYGAGTRSITPDEEKALLKRQKEALQAQLRDISEALKSYDNTGEDK